jgi:hypothetical protein
MTRAGIIILALLAATMGTRAQQPNVCTVRDYMTVGCYEGVQLDGTVDTGPLGAADPGQKLCLDQYGSLNLCADLGVDSAKGTAA